MFCLLAVFMSHLHDNLQHTRLLKEFFPLKTVICDCKVRSASLMQWHNISNFFFFSWSDTLLIERKSNPLHTMLLYTRKREDSMKWGSKLSIPRVSLILFSAIDWVGKVDVSGRNAGVPCSTKSTSQHSPYYIPSFGFFA